MGNFEEDLAALLNKYSIENESNTPDWILAEYIGRCLAAFNMAVHQRDDLLGLLCDEKIEGDGTGQPT